MIKDLWTAAGGVLALLLISLASAAWLFCGTAPSGCDWGLIEDAEVGILTGVGYGISLLLLWPGRRLVARAKRAWLRLFLQSGLIAALLAPSILADPAMVFQIVTPAWMPALCYLIFPPAALAVGLLPISLLWLLLLFLGSLAKDK